MARNVKSLFRGQYEQILIEKLTKGDSVARFCADIGISKVTFYEWVDKYPTFKEAYAQASAASEAHWLEMGDDNIGNPDFSAQMYHLQLASRFGISKSRRIRTKSVIDKKTGKKKTNMEKFMAVLDNFENGEISLDEFNALVDGFIKLSTLKEREEMVARVEKLEATLEERRKNDGPLKRQEAEAY